MNQLFFDIREEAAQVCSTLQHGIVVHLAFLITNDTEGKTANEIFNTDTLPLMPDPSLPRWLLDNKCGGKGIINGRTVTFNLAEQERKENEACGWTVIFSGAKLD